MVKKLKNGSWYVGDEAHDPEREVKSTEKPVEEKPKKAKKK